MYIQQVFNQQIEVGGTDAAIVEVEVMAEEDAHLVDTAFDGDFGVVGTNYTQGSVQRTFSTTTSRTPFF